MLVTPERAHRAVASRDSRFDGCFITGVRSTGIYCRPSCPARTPKADNITFFATAAAAQQAGFRACRRCLPDAVPGSPEWNLRADLAGRAMRLITDGVVDRQGVAGLATGLGYSTRHLTRVLTDELGAGPLSLARAHRAHAARLLIERSDLDFTDVAYAAGFTSLRQFNETVREVFAANPSTLRAKSPRSDDPKSLPAGTLRLRLPFRLPFDADGLFEFFAARAVAGVEWTADGQYARTLRLPHGAGVVRVRPERTHLVATLRLTDLRDLGSAVARLRRLFDLDSDPVAVVETLGGDPNLGSIVRARPGMRLPGSTDGFEMAVRAVLGQQISVASARTIVSGLTESLGEHLEDDQDADMPNRLFPTPETLAERAIHVLPGPRRRAEAVRALAEAIGDDRLRIDPGRAGQDLRDELRAIPGIGDWTADLVAMRVLGEPDTLLSSDSALRGGAERLGLPTDRALVEHARHWSPWRSYAGIYLWRTHAETQPAPEPSAPGRSTDIRCRTETDRSES